MAADVVIDITGKAFEYSMTEITVNQGDVVTINYSSTQGNHDWVIDNMAATDKVRPEDGVTSVTFTANTVGTFEYYCSVGNHREK